MDRAERHFMTIQICIKLSQYSSKARRVKSKDGKLKVKPVNAFSTKWRSISWLPPSFTVLSASKCPVSFNAPGTFTAVLMYPRCACRVPQASAAARSEPQPQEWLMQGSPFILLHALWLCNRWQQTGIGVPCHRAMPQLPLLVYCQLSTSYCPFEGPTHFRKPHVSHRVQAVPWEAVAVCYDFS